MVTFGRLPASAGDESTLLSHKSTKDVHVNIDLLNRGSDELMSRNTLANGSVSPVGEEVDWLLLLLQRYR